MSEIPKDGKTYLAWHREIGFMLARIPFDYWVYDDSGEDVFFAPGDFIRWMDEGGQWHEVAGE